MKFEDMKRIDQQKMLMPILIKLLQNLGGKSSRKELKNEIKTSVREIPEWIIDETKQGKNGRTYHPFNFIFNFSITNLQMAGFLNCPQRGQLALTEKGRMCNVEKLNIEQEVYALSEPIWEERRGKRKKHTNDKIHLEEHEDEVVVEDDDISESWKEEIKQALLQMPPHKFEMFCRALVKAMGVDIDENKGVSPTRDGGIDGYGYIISDDFRTSRVAIQAKRWNDKQRVGTPDIDQFAGAMTYHNAEFGIFITTTDFSRDAIERARSGQRAITLINGDRIIELVEKYQLYIKPTYQLDTFYLEKN